MTKKYVQLGRELRRLRERSGESPEEFARSLGRRVVSLDAYERGDTLPPLSVAERYSFLFRKPIRGIFGGSLAKRYDFINNSPRLLCNEKRKDKILW